MDFFFYGTLCHAPLLRIVLGHDMVARPAQLPDHAVYLAQGQAFPLIVPEPGAQADGVLVQGLSAEDVARLDFYEGGFSYDTEDRVLACGTVARVYVAQPGLWQTGAPWSLSDWQARFGAVVTQTAHDFMALHGQHPPEAVLRRYQHMLVRGASRLRAQAAPRRDILRRPPAPDAVQVLAKRTPYANYFAVEEYDLRYRRFDGALSNPVTLAAFVSGDAATVLPYDPVRDRVLVIEQFRMGVHARGDANPWLIEAIAGRVDAFETPADCARREALEEAGLILGALIEIAGFYPSPGAKIEYCTTFVGIADLPDDAAGLGGLLAETEDIRSHVISFDDLMRVIASPEGGNAPLILTAMWLAANRERLRAGG
jgi:ADP-ribose pyrophosphatase